MYRFSSCCWISTLIFGSDGRWDVLIRGNLTRREDTGQINSSPVSAMSPILRLQYGCRYVIRIPGEHIYIPMYLVVRVILRLQTISGQS